ncbi:OLC1v1001672C1 [Oldenlandia corymbosa var. corymbosa]|uniref:OLC1v1001672C1 n=1 Tax=Oldenlandia corymbosa var. corymbosa TaxID=529605 RepID=A0AAV1D8C0_OLDCO|nr:OLC1v1001672C1 [Oldenlandia corymbosa var. corymbosa]
MAWFITRSHKAPPIFNVPAANFRAPATSTRVGNAVIFLHEQCFQASRSLKHPSHIAHPLVLAPFPTYPTNSFHCDSCSHIGYGFSYCCYECEFDLHIHCALKSNPIPSPLPKNSSVSPYPDLLNLSLGRNKDSNSQPDAVPAQQTQNINHNANFPPSYPPLTPTGGYFQSVQHTNTNPSSVPNDSLVFQNYPDSIPQNVTPNPLLYAPNPLSTTTPVTLPNAYLPEVNMQQYPPTESSSAGINLPESASSCIQEKSLPNPLPAPSPISSTSNPSKDEEIKHFGHP